MRGTCGADAPPAGAAPSGGVPQHPQPVTWAARLLLLGFLFYVQKFHLQHCAQWGGSSGSGGNGAAAAVPALAPRLFAQICTELTCKASVGATPCEIHHLEAMSLWNATCGMRPCCPGSGGRCLPYTLQALPEISKGVTCAGLRSEVVPSELLPLARMAQGVRRYWPGKKPVWLGGDEPEREEAVGVAEVVSRQSPERADPRATRLQQLGERRYSRPAVHGRAATSQVERHEQLTTAPPTTLRQASTSPSPDAGTAVSIAQRRLAMRSRLLDTANRQQPEEGSYAQVRECHLQFCATTERPAVQGEGESNSEDSEETDDSSADDDWARPMVKPVFVPKPSREVCAAHSQCAVLAMCSMIDGGDVADSCRARGVP